MVRLAIYHDDLEKPIGLPYMRRQEMTSELIITKFLLTAQSKRACKLKTN